MSETVLTFHNDPAAKVLRVERCKAHMEADRLRAATYGKQNGQFVACAIGCQLYDIAIERGVDWREINNDDSDRHGIVAADYGWPKWLAYLEDAIFEGLPESDQKEWPLRLVSAVPVGVDISAVRHKLMAFILREMLPKNFDATKYPQVAEAVANTANLHERAAAGGDVTDGEWSAAGSAARSAAWSAAWSAARSAAMSAAESAAWSAARSAAWSAARSAAMSAAESAAWSAARSAARSAAMSAAFQTIADKLCKLLTECASLSEGAAS